jgi:hypothetical protein
MLKAALQYLSARKSQWPLGKSYVPVAPEFASRLAEERDRLETESLVQRKRCRIRKRVAGDDAVNVLARNRFEKRGVKTAADAASYRIMAAINRGFDARFVGSFVAKSHGACIPDHDAVFFSDQKTVPPAGGKLLEPRDARFDRVWRKVKGDWRVDYVVIVNFGETRKVAPESGANADVVHSGW